MKYCIVYIDIIWQCICICIYMSKSILKGCDSIINDEVRRSASKKATLRVRRMHCHSLRHRRPIWAAVWIFLIYRRRNSIQTCCCTVYWHVYRLYGWAQFDWKNIDFGIMWEYNNIITTIYISSTHKSVLNHDALISIEKKIDHAPIHEKT